MNSNKKILVLEDDTNLGFLLREHLEMNSYSVKLCRNGEEGLTEYKLNEYDLCLVDVMMPRKDGFTFVKELREKDSDIPVIFLTAKSLKEDRIEGFKIGCDDYITKPFSMEELILRIQAVLRRTNQSHQEEITQTLFSIGKFSFDFNLRSLTIGQYKNELTSKEAELLRLLCVYQNKVLERETALKLVWGDDSYFNSRSMDVFISKIRKYLKDDSSINLMNIHGKGYKLMVQ
ncbi:MAG: response regulator transcription factor [Ignavibacteriales bacterium]|nr:MAG: response regulator transcription factor [Ignavibacteriales bacterium]